MKPCGPITFTTDFGTRDWFVGTMKGVALAINPTARFVDLNHEIPPGDLRAGAFSLLASCRYFPAGTVHVAIVDPGVGSQRRAVAVETPNYYFVGPDNGLLALVLSQEKVRRIHALENRKYFLEPISRTFHGRDIFAPVAAHLSRGLRIEKLGPAVDHLETLPWPAVQRTAAVISGEIVYIDRFGNAITNLASSLFDPASQDVVVQVNGKRCCPLGSHYQAVPAGRPVAVPGASGFLEIAVNAGNASRSLGFAVGDSVTVWFKPDGGRRQRQGPSASAPK